MKLGYNLVSLFCLCASLAYSQNVPCGIGADVLIIHRVEGDRLQIVGVVSNSPAARAGLAANQVIRSIDGTSAIGLTLKDCVKRIQGAAGTKVLLEVEDRRSGWTNSIEVTREVVIGDPLAEDTSNWVDIPQTQKRSTLLVSTNQLIKVSRTNGAIALIQFTWFGATNANYRWRFRMTPGGVVSAGGGLVFEDYERHVNAFGEAELTQRGSLDDSQVKAGDFQLEWSVGSPTNGWLYYNPSKEKVEVLNLSAFDLDLK
jgi:hypothetical protein